MRIKTYFWKLFLRFGHELVWKADEWFQREEIKIRKIEGETNEGSDAEYHQDGHHQWTRLPGMGRDFRDGREIRGVSESTGGRGSQDSIGDRSGVVRKAQRARSGNGASVDHTRSDAFPGNPRRGKRTKARVSAADFDRRTVARRSAFAGMVLNHGAVAVGE